MNTFAFFIKKADSIQVDCYALGSIEITIIMERDNYGRVNRAINILKDKGLVELSCYEDLGGDGQGSASIQDDELKALLEFVPEFMSGKDQICQISSLLLKPEDDWFTMLISGSTVEIKWNIGTYNQYSCSLSRGRELHFEGVVPKELEKKMQRVACLIWDGE